MKSSMLQLFKKCLWIGLLAFGVQASWAYSLLGPVNIGDDAGEQVTEIGYNPMGGLGPPFIADSQPSGPKNIGDGYRLNTPVLYYTFDPSFGYFGSEGEVAVQQAFDMMNSLSNVDSYSTNLIEFPLNSQGVNYEAETLDLLDIKSITLTLILEQMGLADSVRYDWVLLDRYVVPPTPCPGDVEYIVAQRNYDITATPLNYNDPDVGQYSPYVNGELYTYFIDEVCDAPGASPPTADAIEVPADPLANNPPVASGIGEDFLLPGYFDTSLTRDDMAGLRYLMSSNNVFAPSPGYLETPAAGSTVVSGGGGGLGTTNFNDEFTLTTSNLTQLMLDAKTNGPAALQALYPNLVITSVVSNIFSGTYTYTFGNLITNFFPVYTNFPIQIQVQDIGPVIGAPYGTISTNTTTTTVISNILSGAFLLAPTNTCGLDIIQVLATNVTTVTNFLGSGTNISGTTVSGFLTNIYSTNLVFNSTNYTVLVAPCEFANGGGGTNSDVGDYQGIEKVQYVRIPDNNYDYQTGQFYQPVTDNYSMVLMGNGQMNTVRFQRVVTRPDFLFMGENLTTGGGNVIPGFSTLSRTTPNFINSRTAAGLAGPGIIDPTSSSNAVIILNTVGPIYENTSPTALTGISSGGRLEFIWGSFDGTTNAPIIYPTGTSINLLANEALIQISPTTLPDGANGASYRAALSATGGQPPYTWSLASNSAGLPPGLTLSSSGIISGTPTQSGTFDDIVIQLTDSSHPALTVQMIYSLTIN